MSEQVLTITDEIFKSKFVNTSFETASPFLVNLYLSNF